MKTDSELKKDVLNELQRDPVVPEARVGVAVRDGVVTRSGHLDSYAEKYAVKCAVERVSCVKAIAIELTVIPVGPHQRSDTEIAAAVEHALSWSSSIPEEREKVVVEKGWVTANGELDWNYQSQAVERLVRPLKGIVGFTDNIHLRKTPVAMNLSGRIQDALTRQALREGRRIEIHVDDAAVTLRGRVHSWAERREAEGATWSAPGVDRVNNELVVGP